MSALKLRFKALALALCLSASALEAAPERVVSINLCTDQLLLTLGSEAQIASISTMAQDPLVSPQAARAQDFPANHAQVEEVFRLAPDLVLASEYTNPATLALLRRLGIEVAIFAPEQNFTDLKNNILRAGALLGQTEKAKEVVDAFEAEAARIEGAGTGKRVVFYGPNGFASAGGLWEEILRTAGLHNAVREVMPFSGTMPLETLLTLAPDYVIIAPPYPGASRAEELLRHPALLDMPRLSLADSEWSCGSPTVLNAAARLQRETQ